MANTIKLKKDGSAGGTPTVNSDASETSNGLAAGEVAINYRDGKLYYAKYNGSSYSRGHFPDNDNVQGDATALAIALGQYMANTFKLKTDANNTTSLSAVYTVPSSTTAIVIGCTLSNTSASAITADVKIVTDSSSGENADDVYIVKGAPIPQGGSLEVMSGNKIVLEASDALQAKSSASNALDVVLSIMEIT